MAFKWRLLLIVYGLLILCVPGSSSPVITRHPVDQYVDLTEGNNEYVIRWLDCYIQNLNLGDLVSWKKNGYVIISYNNHASSTVYNMDSSRYSIIHDVSTQFALSITGITESTAVFDSGQYQCVVTFNNNEVIESDLAHLHVYVEPETRNPACQTSIESGAEITEGDTVVFTCTSKSTGSPQVVHKWFRNNLFETMLFTLSSSVINDMLSTTYTWTAIKSDEHILFYCWTNNTRWNTGYSCQVGPFVILSKPDVVVMPAQLKLTSQNYATFTCIASGEPEPYSYVWKYDDVFVASGERFDFNVDRSTLDIKDIDIQDNGDHTITCEVQNAYGVGTDTAYLHVAIIVTITKTTPTNNYISRLLIDSSPIQGITSVINTTPIITSRGTSGLNHTASLIGNGVLTCLLLIIITLFGVYFIINCRKHRHVNNNTNNEPLPLSVYENIGNLSIDVGDIDTITPHTVCMTHNKPTDSEHMHNNITDGADNHACDENGQDVENGGLHSSRLTNEGETQHDYIDVIHENNEDSEHYQSLGVRSNDTYMTLHIDALIE